MPAVVCRDWSVLQYSVEGPENCVSKLQLYLTCVHVLTLQTPPPELKTSACAFA